MRRLPASLLLFGLTLSVWAISGVPACAATIASSRPASSKPASPDAAAARHSRQTWEQHFVQANAAHDGHLTPEEARDGFPLVARHFEDIDADHKGYVTQNDLRAWRIMKKAAHRLAHPPDDKLKPRNATQLVPLRQVPVSHGRS